MKDLYDFLRQYDWLGFIITGLVGAFLSFLFSKLNSLFVIKRKKRCISKCLISSDIYRNLEKDGFKITVSYKDIIFEKPVSVLKIRLRNDGEEDILFSNCFSRNVYLRLDNHNIVEVTVSSDSEGINPKAEYINDNRWDLSWDLLKKDECFYVTIIVADEVKDLSGVNFDIRAEGISQIKTPEIRVKEAMLPMLKAAVILAIPIVVLVPNVESPFADISLKLFLLLILAFCVIFFWIIALYERIKWLNDR